MIALVEGAERQKTPNEIALNILLAGLTIIFLLAVVTLQPFAIYSGAEQSIVVLVALLVCLIPTTIGALLSAIGIAGMDRLVQRNVLAMSGRAVEAAGDVRHAAARQDRHDHLGNRQAAEFIPVPGVDGARSWPRPRSSSSLADETPEGRSIVALAERALRPARGRRLAGAVLVPFTAQTRMSGVDFDRRVRSIRKGATDAVKRWVVERRRHGARRARHHRRRHRRRRRHAAGRGRARRGTALPGPRRHPPQGHRQGRACASASTQLRAHGHPHGDDHRRQPAHRRGHRRRGRRRRLPRRGHARGQDGPDQARSRPAAASSP